MPSITTLALLLIFTGILGYSLNPPREYSSGMAAISSVHITYTVFGLFVFSDIYGFYILREVLSIFMLAVAIMGTYFLSRLWGFRISRFRDAVFYVSLVYVVCQDVRFPLGKGVEYITGVVALAIVALSAYMMYTFKRLEIVPIIERPELFTVQFMVVSFTGVYCVTASLVSILVALALSVYALQALVSTGFRKLHGLLCL